MATLNPLLVSLLSAEKTSLEEALSHASGASSVSDRVECGVQCLELFCQLNWTGPPDSRVHASLEGLVGIATVDEFNQEALSALGCGGQTVYRLCVLPLLLHVSNFLLLSPSVLESSGEPLLIKRSAIQCLFVQQHLLEERSSMLWEKVCRLMETLDKLTDTSGLSESEQGELYLELGHVALYYLQYDRAKSYFERAGDMAHIAFTLMGALGKRTRFQETNIAQLVLKVTSEADDTHHNHEVETVADLPKEIGLDDDTLLDKVVFADAQSKQYLQPLQQAVLLAWCAYQKKTKAVDRINSEEMEAYLSCVLESPQCWVVQGYALFLKSQLGRQRHRLQQRNMQQLEELVQSFSRHNPEIKSRMKFFHSVPMTPIWTIQKELAGVLVGLGCMGSAVEVLSRLELWEDLAVCYQAIGRKAKAKEVVQQRLDLHPTPSLLCLMGDIAQDPDYYKQAWEVSNAHSSRAQRSLGLWYLRKEQYEDCIVSLQQSLAINSLQDGLWFSLGCAASQVGDLDLSIKAWHRAVALQPDFAECWNNLAGAYLKKKDKQRAHRIFQEALRCSYDNPRIWENFLVVSCDLQCWEDSLRAYHRMIDLQHKFVDAEILSVFVHGITEGFSDSATPPASQYRSALGELLGRVTSMAPVKAEVWSLYAQFHLSSTDREEQLKGVSELQKAQRAIRLKSGWEREVEGLASVSTLTLDYCRACRQLFTGGQGEKKDALASLSSAKLALQGVLKKAKGFGVTSEEQVECIVQDLQAELELLSQSLSTVNT